MLGIDLSNLTQFKPFQPQLNLFQPASNPTSETDGLSYTNQQSDPFARIQSILNHRLSEILGQQEQTVSVSAPESAFDADEVANNILGMVKTRLKQAKAEGADQAQLEAMREQAKIGVEQGIKEAREILDNMDMLSDSVESGIDRIQELITKGIEPELQGESDTELEGEVETGAASLIEVAHRFDQRTETSFEMEIKTQDGDLIKLNFSQLDRQQDSFSYQSTADSEQYQAGHIESSRSRYELSIEGELDDSELAAITELANNVQQLSENFFDGNVQAAFDQGMQLGYDTGEIAGFALELQYSQISTATTRYREINELDTVGGANLPGLDQVGGLLGQINNIIDSTSKTVEPEHAEQTTSSMLKGFLSHHPKAGEFSEMLHRYGDDELEDVVEQLVGQVRRDRDD